MNDTTLYPLLIAASGIFMAATILIFLTHFSKKVTRMLGFYPESRSILAISLKIISWFLCIIIFFVFLRLALKMLGLEFTKSIVESVIMASPKYILAVVLICLGSYVSRVIRERAKEYTFEAKERMLLILDLIIYMTFIFTAFYLVGIEIVFFLEFYKVILWIVGTIVALVISMTIGIPLGMNIYEKMKKERRTPKKRRMVKT